MAEVPSEWTRPQGPCLLTMSGGSLPPKKEKKMALPLPLVIPDLTFQCTHWEFPSLNDVVFAPLQSSAGVIVVQLWRRLVVDLWKRTGATVQIKK